MRFLIVLLLGLNCLQVMASQLHVENTKNDIYLECGSDGLPDMKSVFGVVGKPDFTQLSSLQEFLNYLLVEQNENITRFLSKKDRINEPDYVEQALEFFQNDSSFVIDCFYDYLKENDLIYRFYQGKEDGFAEGFVIVNNEEVKVVFYTRVLQE